MKKLYSKLFSGETKSLSYLAEIKDFLLGMIIPVILFILSDFIPVNTPFRMITVIVFVVSLFMCFLLFVRLIGVSDNKELNDIKRDGYKYKFKPIKINTTDLVFLLNNAKIPETLYLKSSLKINYKFDIDFETKGKNGPFINKKFYLDGKEISSVQECISIMMDLKIINKDVISIYESFDHSKPELILHIIDDLKKEI